MRGLAGFGSALLVALQISWASAEAITSPHCYQVCPSGAPTDNDLVIRDAYSLSANGETKFADWVAYRITAETFGPSRPRNWRADPALPPEKRLEPGDFSGAHRALAVDRGHLAPLASLAGTRDWAATNYLSNITPQKSALNQGAWAKLEAAERHLVRQGFKIVYVLTGPLYEHAMPALPKAEKPHKTPSGYWKMIVAVLGKEIHAATFILSQDTPYKASFCDGRTTISTVERRANLDLPDEDLNSRPLEPLLGCAR